MRIGIAAVLGTVGGPRTYMRALVEALARVGHEHEYWILTDAPQELPKRDNVHPVHVPLANRYAQLVWDHVRVPRALARLPVQVFHHAKAALPLGLRMPSVVSIYDAAPFLHPRTFTPLQGLHHRNHIRDAARRATRVVTVSEEARDELSRASSLDPARVAVVRPGASRPAPRTSGSRAPLATRARLGIRGRYFLSLGTIQPRKELTTVIRGFQRARRESGLDHQLVLAGRNGWHSDEVVRLARGPARRGEIVVTGLLDDADVGTLLDGAEAVVNASRYEGFGLTVLEALCHGTPLVSTPVPALTGASPNAFVRIEPGDVEGLAQALARVSSDPELRAELRTEGLRHAARFSWDDAARSMLAVYHEAVDDHRPPS